MEKKIDSNGVHLVNKEVLTMPQQQVWILSNNALGCPRDFSVVTVNTQDNRSEVNTMNTDKSRDNNLKLLKDRMINVLQQICLEVVACGYKILRTYFEVMVVKVVKSRSAMHMLRLLRKDFKQRIVA